VKYYFHHIPSYLLQRRIRNPKYRECATRLIQIFLPRADLKKQANADLEKLEIDGWAPVVGLLSDEQTRALRHYFSVTQGFDRYEPGRKVMPFVDPSKVCQFSSEAVLKSPGFLTIANNPEVLKTVEGYLGVRPTISNISAWWSFESTDPARDAEK
jgi:hypothetical protein